MTGLKSSRIARARRAARKDFGVYNLLQEYKKANKRWRQYLYFNAKLYPRILAQEKELDELRSKGE